MPKKEDAEHKAHKRLRANACAAIDRLFEDTGVHKVIVASSLKDVIDHCKILIELLRKDGDE